jgi:hypothetical protein
LGLGGAARVQRNRGCCSEEVEHARISADRLRIAPSVK